MRRLTFLLSAASALADTYARQGGIDVEHYRFRLELSDETDEIVGEATISVRFTADRVAEFALDLASKMTVTSTGVRHENDRLTIPIDPPAAFGSRRQFTIRYRGIPASGLRTGKNKHGERTFFGLNWPNLAHQWLPMVDHPHDKATSEFIVTAPSRYQVVSNGLLQEERDLGDGRRLTHWKQSVPIASWLNTIGVAQFSTRHAGSVRGIPLETWVFHQDAEAGAATFEEPARRAIEFFSDRIGPYPYEKLANIQAPGLNGGTEHASAILYGETVVNGKPATDLVAHEIAHQWFGDSVTEKDWDDVWLSEGFATYFTLLATEHFEGRDALVAGLERARKAVAAAQEKQPGQAVIHRNLADPANVLNRLVYQKGAWVLHMLRGLMGTEHFWAGIRTYYARHRDGNASTDDFREAMEQQHGTGLGWFFDQWLRRPGSPTVKGGWKYDAATRRLIVTLEQTQAGEPFRLPLELGVQDTIERVEMTAKHQSFELPLEKAPIAVALDPGLWILMDANFTAR